MFDLRIITAKALLTVDTVAPIRGFAPPSLMVIGQNLYKATDVEYNGVLTEEWIVASPNRLLVRIPSDQIGRPFVSIRVFADIDLTNSRATIDFRVPSPLRKISGIERLVQAWLLIFFTTPGSDVFDPSSGGGARTLIGKNTDRHHRGVAADIALCIERTKSELLRLQAQAPVVPPDERLLSSELVGVTFDESSSISYASVSLKNMVGDAAQLALG